MLPVKKNEEFTLNITGMNHEGQGVGRIDGFTVFVDGAIEGEDVQIKIIKLNKSYGVGKLLKVLKTSQDRSEPFCPAYKRCGGCSLQHMSMHTQLLYKTNLVKESLKRIGKLDNVKVHDTIGMKEPFFYRNKSQFPVGIISGKAVAGFYAKRSHEIIEAGTCAIQNKISDRIKDIARDFINSFNIPVYDEKTGKGLIRHIMTRVAFKTSDTMVVVVINGKDLPHKDQLVKDLLNKEPSVKSIFLNINTQNTNIILGDTNIKIYGEDAIVDSIGDLKFRISPLSFFQVNPIQTEVLYQKALEYAALTGNETVFDLYCGTGTISLFLARNAQKVFGVEVVEDAVNDAKKNALMNGITNVAFVAGQAEKIVNSDIKADVVLVDPPRKGCDEALLKTLVEIGPDRIVYVSCNPSTLARDLKFLSENGFSVLEAQPVDMFPWTTHVETVCLIQRVESE